MSMKSFLERFTPSANRGEVDAVVDLIKTQLDITTDIWSRYADDVLAGRIVFDSAFAKDFELAYRRSVSIGSKSWIDNVRKNFITAQSVVAALREHYLDKSVGAVARSMPLQTATAYRVLALLGMAAEYGNALLIALTTTQFATGNSISPAEVKYLERLKRSFLQVMALLDKDGKNIDKLIKSIPDVDVDSETVDRVTSVNGNLRTDPLRSNLIAIDTNPFYYIGMRWATWQAAKHRKAKDELRQLEYRLLMMQQAADGAPDAKTEKAIEYYAEERKKLIAQIAKLEE